MFYEMTIAGLKRQLPLCKVTDDLYIAAFIMFSDVEITKAAAGELLKRAPQFDIMITAESKGIPLAYEMARQSGASDYIVARKGPKLYMPDIITTEVDSITTDHCLLYTSFSDCHSLKYIKGSHPLCTTMFLTPRSRHTSNDSFRRFFAIWRAR